VNLNIHELVDAVTSRCSLSITSTMNLLRIKIKSSILTNHTLAQTWERRF